MARYDADGGQIPRTLFEAAAFHRSLRARCPACGNEAVFHAAALWWLFQRRQWPDRLVDAGARLRCSRCGRRGTQLELTRDPPTIVDLPLPNDVAWRRAVSRFRA
jgi:DNA-directed RNA polymerase subunit RPC12/RpoP